LNFDNLAFCSCVCYILDGKIKAMETKIIPLDDLVVNKANDRHGELASEDTAIEWLLKHKTTHMCNLAKDVVRVGQVYEPPLVAKEGNKYKVYDGNRRTTVLKLLRRPERSPTHHWYEFFTKLRCEFAGPLPSEISCQIENDRERLDDILYRRHTGQQSGIGQSQWDAEAKSNFQRRTGKETRVNVAEEIEYLLKSEGLLGHDDRLPRSNLNRLLSAEPFRNRVGIALENNDLKFTHNREPVLSALDRIARDLRSKKVTLDDIWDNDSKRRYLDSLGVKGMLPMPDQALPTPKPVSRRAAERARPEHVSSVTKSVPTENRKTLIRQIEYHISLTHENRKALDIWNELQHWLFLGQHDNAISVLFRVLLELSIECYMGRHSVSKGASLADKLSRVREHMLSRALIDKKYRDQLEKFENAEVIFSANTLNAYVHSSNFFPSENHLKSLWDTLEKFIIICLRD